MLSFLVPEVEITDDRIPVEQNESDVITAAQTALSEQTRGIRILIWFFSISFSLLCD